MARHDKRRDATAPRGSLLERRWLWLVLALGIVAAAVVVFWPAPQDRFKPLLGRWRRVGEVYTLAVERVTPDGAVEAHYFNPEPIKVGAAKAEEKAGALHLVVELRDAQYPGSTYTLTYDAGADLLRGTYFEANYGQSFEVEFKREN